MDRKILGYYGVLAAIAFMVLSPVLWADFLNWDDTQLLCANREVLTFDVAGIFTKTVLGTFIPLTSLSFAIEHAVFGLNPFIFHLDNLLLHISISVLLMGLFMRMGASVRAAFLGALLFAIHPMHVESVAWISERKDVLYALFYVLALRVWWSYLEARQPRDLVFVVVFAGLSLLAKAMAISLPLVMLLMEYFRDRDLRRIRWAAYVPVMLLTVAIGAVTYSLQVRNPVENFLISAVIWLWSLKFYIWKFFLPFGFDPIYFWPKSVMIFAWPYLFAVLFVFVLFFLVVRRIVLHHDRWFLWAAGTFFFSIFFILRFDIRDFNVVADRFMYLPSFGICIWLGIKADRLIARYGKSAAVFLVAGGVFLGVQSFTYTMVWRNSLTFWEHVIRHYPDEELGYEQRARAKLR